VIPLRDNVPTRSTPIVTWALIAANVVVWLWQVTGTPVNEDVARYAYYPCAVDPPCVGPAADHLNVVAMTFTSMFMHGSWLHIAGNMLFLWIFGNNVEDALGKVRFLLFYLAAGVAATALQTFVTVAFSPEGDSSIPNVGASGAIAGVLGAYFVLLPHARVLSLVFLVVFFFFVEVPAIVFLGVWFVFQLWEGGFQVLAPDTGGGVAFFAHVGGFLFGLLTIRAWAVRRPLRPRW
jgi:membrane associated rhomboid family serine protease